MDLRPATSEVLGTFLLMLVGGATILGGGPGWLAFGLAVLVLVYALGPVGGAHFNPAVTLGFAAVGRFPWRRVPAYLTAQLLGAFAACLLLPNNAPLVVQAPAWGEAAGTFLLTLTIAAVATERALSGLAIGAAVAAASLAFSAGLNPARALAPAALAGQWAGLWPHLLGPLAGGVAGMAAHRLLLPREVPA